MRFSGQRAQRSELVIFLLTEAVGHTELQRHRAVLQGQRPPVAYELEKCLYVPLRPMAAPLESAQAPLGNQMRHTHEFLQSQAYQAASQHPRTIS